VKTIAVLAATLAVAGCAHETGGAARAASSSAATSSTTPAAPTTTGTPVVPAASIKGDLLKGSELGAIVGDTDMVGVQTYTEPDNGSNAADPFWCGLRLLAASSVGYYAPGRLAMYGDANRGAGGKLAEQVVAAFIEPKLATQFLATNSRDWAQCPDGKAFPVAFSNHDGNRAVLHWVPDKPVDTPTRIATTLTAQEGPPRTCSHVIAIYSNVVVEGGACGDGDTMSQANTIADQILAKVRA
jgi:hypothetical protein